jgi:hypothetical protein
MTHRILPRAEYSRLVGTELEAVWPHLPPSACVIVVEDDGGAIAGCWCCFTSVHAEGVWIAPWHRRSRTVIARQLMAAMAEQLEALGAAAFMTGAVSDGVRAIIRKLGGAPLPGEQYVIQTERLTCQQP